MVIDVWNPEPAFRLDVLKAADLASAHIAGHSFEGKLNGTMACYQELCNFFEIPRTGDISASLPDPQVPVLEIDCSGHDDEYVLNEIIKPVYDIEADDAHVREAAAPDEITRARNFDALRKNYRTRREFGNTRIYAAHATAEQIHKIQSLGFSVQAG